MIAILNRIRFEILVSNPLEISREALIVPNNSNLNFTNLPIFNNIKNFQNKVKNYNCKIGDAIITETDELIRNYSYFIHSCSITDIDANGNTLNSTQRISILGQSIASSLDLAYKNGIKTLAFHYMDPLIIKLKTEVIINVLIKITFAYLKKRPLFINRVTFLVDNDKNYKLYFDKFKKFMNFF